MPVYLAALPKLLLATRKGGELRALRTAVDRADRAHRYRAESAQCRAPAPHRVLTFGAAFFFYIHFPDPTWWILSSAPRVLLTPLAALLIASAAAWRSAGDLS